MSLPVLDEELEILDFLDDEILCESSLRAHQHPHPADWYALSPCGDVTPICEKRRALCRMHDGWRCLVRVGSGCSGYHHYNQIEFVPIKGG